MHFIQQTASGIREKLPKSSLRSQTRNEQLVEITFSVFYKMGQDKKPSHKNKQLSFKPYVTPRAPNAWDTRNIKGPMLLLRTGGTARKGRPWEGLPQGHTHSVKSLATGRGTVAGGRRAPRPEPTDGAQHSSQPPLGAASIKGWSQGFP